MRATFVGIGYIKLAQCRLDSRTVFTVACRNWTLGLIGHEPVLAGAMAIGYIAFIQPTAPRYHQAAAAKVVTPTLVDTVVPVPVIVAPAVAPPAAVVPPKVTPAKSRTIPAAPAAKAL